MLIVVLFNSIRVTACRTVKLHVAVTFGLLTLRQVTVACASFDSACQQPSTSPLLSTVTTEGLLVVQVTFFVVGISGKNFGDKLNRCRFIAVAGNEIGIQLDFGNRLNNLQLKRYPFTFGLLTLAACNGCCALIALGVTVPSAETVATLGLLEVQVSALFQCIRRGSGCRQHDRAQIRIGAQFTFFVERNASHSLTHSHSADGTDIWMRNTAASDCCGTKSVKRDETIARDEATAVLLDSHVMIYRLRRKEAQ